MITILEFCILGVRWVQFPNFPIQITIYSYLAIAQLFLCFSHLQVISIMAETLAPFDEDNIIPAFGFGDLISKHKTVFPLSPHVSHIASLSLFCWQSFLNWL